MPGMGAFDQLRGLFRAPASPESPRFEHQSWNNSLAFTLNAPPEITGLASFDGFAEPRIDRATAMQVPAVKRVRDLIAGTLGTLQPRMIDSDNRDVESELLDQPENDIARSITMTNTIEDMLFEKHGWWRIVGYGADGYPSKVVRLEARSVTVREEGVFYTSSITGQPQGYAERQVPDAELIRFDSPSDGLLTAGAAAIRQALLLGRAASRYARNPMPLGFFTPQDENYAPGDKTKVDEMLDHFEEQTQRRAWAYMDGMKAQTLSWSPEQMALTAQRDQAVLEIARLGGVDPEELGVSTTSRTYANSETRRLDLIDFTLIMYVTAIEDRLKMDDVSQPGRRAVYDYSGFLRSDTLSRLQAYAEGLKIGVYTPERIAQIERIPVASVQKALRRLEEEQKPKPIAVPSVRTPAQASQPPKVASTMDSNVTAIGFTATFDPSFQMTTTLVPPAQPATPVSSTEDDHVSVSFAFGDLPEELEFRADGEKRVVAGLILPFGVAAWSGGRQWEFAPGSLHWSALGRVKLDDDHKNGTECGVANLIDQRDVGYFAKFKMGRGQRASELLMDAVDGIRDGFSVYVDFSGEADGWTEHPMKPGVRLVHSATLRKVALTAIPSFDDARVVHVAATREGQSMNGTTAQAAAQGVPAVGAVPPALAGPAYTQEQVQAAFAAGQAAAAQNAEALAATVAAAFGPALAETLKPIIDALPAPGTAERPVVRAGAGVTEVVEPPVYRLNGHGFSLVRDTWKHRTEGDHEAGERLRKFSRQTEEASKKAMDALAFGATTGNASQIIPPGYRPELFVTQLMQGRPLVGAVSRGTLSDATPFNIPKYVSSSGMSAEHVEGVNPSDGTLTLGIATVSPTAISGKFTLTREIVDSANPAIDAIAVAAMQESYSQQTEAIVYNEINGTNGVGGTITSGFVPSGAQVSTTTGQGDELLAGVRAANALYPFRRFAAPNRAHISQEAASAYASAVDGANRPLLPFEAPQNVVGTSSPLQGGYRVDGLLHVPTWSMTGNAAGDADVIEFNSADIWAWESALLMFRFEERNGPAFIDLALFGYFAARVLRPVGLMAVRHTAA